MKSFLEWLSKPYYFNPSAKFKFKMSLAFGFSVFIFLYVFRPFNLASFKSFLFEYTLSIGIYTFIGLFFMLIVPPLLFKNYFNEDNWTVGRNLFLIIVTILCIGTILWCYANVFKSDKELKNIGFFSFLLYSFLVGIIPAFFIIFINEKDVRERREKKAQEITSIKKRKLLEKEVVLKEKIVIHSDNNKESISFYIDDLIYITSQGNYASFFLKRDNEDVKEKILRVTLQKINNDLEKFSKIIRCHKSYIVNTAYVTAISGNARGYLLETSHISFDIPVSRGFSKKSLLQLLTD